MHAGFEQRPRQRGCGLLVSAVVALFLYATVGFLDARTTSEDRGQGRPGRKLPGEAKALGPGKLLVASRELRDPNFAETVVLLIDYDKDGAAGLIVNVRVDVPLSGVFGHLNLGLNATRPAFSGGPVARTSALALVRSRSPMTGARAVAPGVHVIATRELLEQTLTTDTDPGQFRVYLGRAGWASGQLERETARGAWHVFAAEAELVFDPDPTTVWRRLIRRTEMQQASTGLPALNSAL
jgi:putative transcriptional regulator